MCPFSFFSKIERERLRDSSILPLNPYSNLLLNNMLHSCNKFFVVLQHTYYATPLPSCSRKPKICSLCQNKEYRRELFCRLKVFDLKEEIFLHRLYMNCTIYTVCQLNIAVNGYFLSSLNTEYEDGLLLSMCATTEGCRMSLGCSFCLFVTF